MIKSYWFKTFTHSSFSDPSGGSLFYIEGKKVIQKGLITNHLTDIGLAYWIMSDGSLQKDKKTLILHTQGFTFQENEILSIELNAKFGFNSKVIPHKNKYWVIQLSSKDAKLLKNLIQPHVIECFNYKIPVC